MKTPAHVRVQPNYEMLNTTERSDVMVFSTCFLLPIIF